MLSCRRPAGKGADNTLGLRPNKLTATGVAPTQLAGLRQAVASLYPNGWRDCYRQTCIGKIRDGCRSDPVAGDRRSADLTARCAARDGVARGANAGEGGTRRQGGRFPKGRTVGPSLWWRSFGPFLSPGRERDNNVVSYVLFSSCNEKSTKRDAPKEETHGFFLWKLSSSQCAQFCRRQNCLRAVK